MKLTNTSGHDTAALRRFILAGCRAGGLDAERLNVKVATRKGLRTASIRAWGEYPSLDVFTNQRRQGRRMAFFLPPADLDLREFAWVVMHEVGHCTGLRHREMSTDLRTCNGPMPTWAAALTVPKQAKAEPAQEAPVDHARARQQARAEHAQAMLATWERKAKAAAARVRKWKARATYYERKAAAGWPVAARTAPPKRISAKAAAEDEAKLHGVELRDLGDEIEAEAPDGKLWTAVGGHCLSERYGDGDSASSAYCRITEDMKRGLEDCPPDCPCKEDEEPESK